MDRQEERPARIPGINPVADDDSSRGRQLNRRVEILLKARAT